LASATIAPRVRAARIVNAEDMNGGRSAAEREYTITVSVSRTRFLAAVFIASVVLAVAGIAWDAARFGWGEAGQLAHLQNEITRRVTELGRAVETTAVRVSRQSDLVAAAARHPTSSRHSLRNLAGRCG
jgi:hypothetical protein